MTEGLHAFRVILLRGSLEETYGREGRCRQSLGPTGIEFVRGLTKYLSETAAKVRGLNSEQLAAMLG